MIDAELGFEAILCQSVRRCHDAGIIAEHVDVIGVAVYLGGGFADLLERSEIQFQDPCGDVG